MAALRRFNIWRISFVRSLMKNSAMSRENSVAGWQGASEAHVRSDL
jgi:hypothetical protein